MAIQKEDKSISDIRNNLQLVSSNKFNVYQSKMFFVGISVDILLNRKLFKNNLDLKPFIEKHYISKVENEENFKDYLYLSRTALAARLSRLVYEKMNYSLITKISNSILEDLPEEERNNTKRKSSNPTDDSIGEWMDYISSGGKK